MRDFFQNFYDDFLYRFNPKHIYQKVTRGFSDRDLYNLDRNLAKLIHKRMKIYSKMSCGDYCAIPDNYEYMALWKRDLRKIEFAFEKLSDSSQDWLDASKHFEKIKDSDNPIDSEMWIKVVEYRRNYIDWCLQIFAKNFRGLWL